MTDQDNEAPAAAPPIPKIIRPDRCERCKFAVPENTGRFFCHRNPPIITHFIGPTDARGTPGVLSSSGFPIVQAEQWCGEFEGGRILQS